MSFSHYWTIELAAYPLSDADIKWEDTDGCHAKLTVTGWEKIAKRKYGSNVPLLEVQDYMIKEEGGINWLPFPNLPTLQTIRHKWILVRNEQPKVPSFCKAPMPDKHNQVEERNARIVMTYFHPFTLQDSVVDDTIPHASDLRRGSECWTTALSTWLDGNVLTHESRDYIQNFFCVAQMRPDFTPNSAKHDEDIFSDEEIDMETCY